MLLEEPNYIYSWSKKSTTEVELFKNGHNSFVWAKSSPAAQPCDECKKAAVQLLFGCSTETRVTDSSSFLCLFGCGWSQSWNAAVLPAVAERAALPSVAFQSSCNLIFMDSVGWNRQHNGPSCGMTFRVMWGIMNKIALFCFFSKMESAASCFT